MQFLVECKFHYQVHSVLGGDTHNGGFTGLRPGVETWANLYLWQQAGRGGVK